MNFIVALIKQQIKDRKMSIRDLARNSGLDHSFLAKVIAGKRTLARDEKILRRLARALALDPVWFVFCAGLIPHEYRKIFCDTRFVAGLTASRPAGWTKTVNRPTPNEQRIGVVTDRKKSITEELL
jgi:transcriptional regulator with XRE-family HTH domain